MVAPGKQSAGATLGCLPAWLLQEGRVSSRPTLGGREKRTHSRSETGMDAMIIALQTVHWIVGLAAFLGTPAAVVSTCEVESGSAGEARKTQAQRKAETHLNALGSLLLLLTSACVLLREAHGR